MKSRILAFIAIAAMSAIGPANADTWECSILLGGDHKVTLTQESDPALSDEDYVEGTVTGPYGKKYKASVSIDGFDRRWDYKSKDGSGEYAIFLKPGGIGGFYDFTGKGKGELLKAKHILVCKQMEERHLVEEEKSETKLPARGNQRGSNTLREAYILAIRQKVERNWIKPAVSGKTPACEVHVVQGPGGIILDVTFGACGGSNAAYRASIENAVYRAEPLPAPGDPSFFERELTFLFNPGESPKRGRSGEEIERVFQHNKGILFNLYNRALRYNPSLAGQVVIELTISPNGQVSDAKVLSSELSDEKLELNLIEKIKMFRFPNADVQEITVTYPIDFLPS